MTEPNPRMILEEVRKEDPLSLPADATPLDGLRAVYTNGKIPLQTRLKAMVEAAPYSHPKLTATIAFDGKDFAARLDRANARMARANEPKEIQAREFSLGDEIQSVLENPPTAPILPVPDKRYRR